MSLRCLAIAPFVAIGCFVSAPPNDGGVDATADAGDAAPEAATCAPGPDAGDLPCDVSAVFQARCQKCHTTPQPPPPNAGPFPLRTYEELTSPFGSTDLLRWQRVSQVIEPNNFPHMPPPTEPQLTQSDFDTLRAWFDACAPALAEGTGCDVGEGDAGDASTD